MGLLALIVWVGAFSILFLYALFNLYQSVQATFWPNTEGEIINVGISEERDSDGDLFFSTQVRYRYTVENITYQSTRVAYGLDSWAFYWLVSGAFKEAVKLYPNAVVKYDPQSPNESTLVTGVKRFHIASLLLYGCFGLMPVYVL